MTVLVDFPVSSEASEPVDPALLRSVARGLNHGELMVALHASGAELATGQWRDLEACWSLVELGLARLGLARIRETVAALDRLGLAAVREIDAGGTGVSSARAYNRLLGGSRRASRLSLFAFELRTAVVGR